MAELARERARARLRRRCTCSATTTAACPTPRRTRVPTTSRTRRSTKRSAGSCAIIRDERPQVIITYRDERNFYPHPDHIRVHEISVPAFDLAGDPEAYPDAGEPWQPSKLYYVSWSIARVKALHEAYLDRGEESAYTSWFERGFDTEPQGRVHDAHRRRRLPRQAARGAARAPHAGRPRTATGCASPTT